MPHLYNNIPLLLKQHPNWVAWGIRSAPPKSPYNPASLLAGKPVPAKAGVHETWGSYQTAVECVRRGLSQGIGYEFDGSEIYGVDLDHVINETGMLTLEAREIVGQLASYAEISPSGNGLHIFVLAPGADITRHRKKGHFLEIYNNGRYFTVTGNIYGSERTIGVRTAKLQFIHDKHLLPDVVQRTVAILPHSHISRAMQERFLRIGLERDRVYGRGSDVLATRAPMISRS